MPKDIKKCDNIFCIHNAVNDKGKPESWHKTNCSIFGTDPYRKFKNPGGFKIEGCSAYKKYKNMGW